MKKIIAATALATGLSVATAGTVAAGPGGGKSCEALNEAHMTIIENQGLERHLQLGVHTKAFTKLLAQCG